MDIWSSGRELEACQLPCLGLASSGLERVPQTQQDAPNIPALSLIHEAMPPNRAVEITVSPAQIAVQVQFLVELVLVVAF